MEYLKGVKPDVDVEPTSKPVDHSQNLLALNISINSPYLLNSAPQSSAVFANGLLVPHEKSVICESLGLTSELLDNVQSIAHNHTPLKAKWRTLMLDEYLMDSTTVGQKPLINPRFISQSINTKVLNVVEEYPNELNSSHPWVHQNVEGKTVVRKVKQEIHQPTFPPLEKLKKFSQQVMPLVPVELPFQPTQIQEIKSQRPRRRYRTASSTQNDTGAFVSLPLSTHGSSRIERIKYSEIITPHWYQYALPQNESTEEFSVEEDLSDDVFLSRHAPFDIEEHNKYLMALQMGRRYKKRQSTVPKGGVAQNSNAYAESSVANNITLYNEDSVSRFFA